MIIFIGNCLKDNYNTTTYIDASVSVLVPGIGWFCCDAVDGIVADVLLLVSFVAGSHGDCDGTVAIFRLPDSSN